MVLSLIIRTFGFGNTIFEISTKFRTFWYISCRFLKKKFEFILLQISPESHRPHNFFVNFIQKFLRKNSVLWIFTVYMIFLCIHDFYYFRYLSILSSPPQTTVFLCQSTANAWKEQPLIITSNTPDLRWKHHIKHTKTS